MAGITNWTCRIDDIGPDGYVGVRQATAEEIGTLAGELGVEAVRSLEAEVRIKSIGGSGRYKLTGRVQAALTQSCVVTLEPLSTSIDEVIEVEYWPAEQIGPLSEGEHSVLEADTPEPIENGRIDIGRLVYETVSASIDPYPRKSDAALDADILAGANVNPKPESPFAVLAKLKKP